MIQVTVGVPTLNGPERLERLLNSLRDYTNWDRVRRSMSVNLVICDDCSEDHDAYQRLVDAHPQLRAEVSAMTLLRNDTRRGIAATWNRVVGQHAYDVAVLLNDDIEVSQDWLDVLVYSLKENPRAGMVALNSYVALTRLQHQVAFPGMLDHVRTPRVDYHEAQLMSDRGNLLATTGSAFGFRKDAYDAADGFDERYFCFYEELDFGVALRGHGYEHFISSYPLLYHTGGSTNSDPKNMNAAAEMAKSRAAFIAKWQGTPTGLRASFRTKPKRDTLPLREWNTLIGNWA